MDTELIISKLNEFVVNYGLKFILAIITLILGWWIIKIICKVIKKGFKKRKVEETLSTFLNKLISTTLKLLLIVIVIGILGVETASLVAVIAAAGFAVGFALQGSLANFAAGVLIILTKPYVKGDYIESQGNAGTVMDVDILVTKLKTIDGRIIFLPNGAVFNNPIINVTKEDKLRVDLVFGVSYKDNVKKVMKIINSVVSKHKLILKDPEPFIRLGELADSSINFTVRAWTKTEDKWTVHFDLIEQIKEAFDKEGINIPFPQMDVNLKNRLGLK